MIGGRVYPIRTDFRVGVRYEMAASAGTLTEGEFLSLWFPAEVPEDLDEALAAVGSFYCLGREPEEPEGPAPYSFLQDAGPIYAAFRRCYGIDLRRADLHWWQFQALLEGLIGHSFQDRVRFRTEDLRGLEARERAEHLRYRRLYAVEDRTESLREHLRRLEEISQTSKEGK